MKREESSRVDVTRKDLERDGVQRPVMAAVSEGASAVTHRYLELESVHEVTRPDSVASILSNAVKTFLKSYCVVGEDSSWVSSSGFVYTLFSGAILTFSLLFFLPRSLGIHNCMNIYSY